MKSGRRTLLCVNRTWKTASQTWKTARVSLPSVIVIKADVVLKYWCYLLVGGVLLVVNGKGTQWTGGLGILSCVIGSAWFERDLKD